jgi:hypothetical protein
MKQQEHERARERAREREPEGEGVGRELRDLPARDTDGETAERVRRAAVDAFVEGHALRARPWAGLAMRTARALPPLVVVGTVGIYLAWAISTANALFGGH